MYQNKYKNVRLKTEYGTFDSKREFNRWLQLLEMYQQGKIKKLQRQVKYELIPTARTKDGYLIERSCSYIADFQYETEDGLLVVEDAKGKRTQEYVIKRKLMYNKYGIVIREV